MSSKKAVTAVHGVYDKDQDVEVIDIHGVRKYGTISFMRYEANRVDIAVVELIDPDVFQHSIPFHSTPVKIDKDLRVIGLRDDGTGEFTTSIRRAYVEEVIAGTAIIHASYYAVEGMSGAGVVTSQKDGQFSVVGVHVGKHDDTEALSEEEQPKRKKSKKSDLSKELQSMHKELSNHKQKYRKDQITINSNIHGHGAYSLICEIARVEGLVNHLNN